MKNLRIAILVSGGGTTMAAVLAAIKGGRLRGVEVPLVIASKPNIGAITKAQGYGVPTVLVATPTTHSNAEHFGDELANLCRSLRIDIVCQYGWMPKTPGNFIDAYAGRMVNQHPGPLDPGYPDFGGQGMFGRRVHEARILHVRATLPRSIDPTDEQGYRRYAWTEVSAQLVDPEYDRGALIDTERVIITADDTAETLAARTLPAEHQLQIRVLERIVNADGRIEPMPPRAERLIEPVHYRLLKFIKAEAAERWPKG